MAANRLQFDGDFPIGIESGPGFTETSTQTERSTLKGLERRIKLIKPCLVPFVTGSETLNVLPRTVFET
jgi:hypothetical protein